MGKITLPDTNDSWALEGIMACVAVADEKAVDDSVKSIESMIDEVHMFVIGEGKK